MTENVKQTKGADLSGLDDFNISSLVGSDNKPKSISDASSISYAPLDHFHLDEDNARLEMDKAKLKELADSMTQINPTTGKPRGILEPLSVKHHPDIPGHFIINGGNRRYLAADIAELTEAPYIIKDELDDFDKFVLNDQREQLSPLENAMFIKSRLEEGHKSGEIAKALGRPASFVSDHSIFFSMAPSIRDLYDSNICRSMQALALLHRARKKYEQSIELFCKKANAKGLEVTTSQVRALVTELRDSQNNKTPVKEQINEVKLTPEVRDEDNVGDLKDIVNITQSDGVLDNQNDYLSEPKSLNYYMDLTSGGEFHLNLNQDEACIALKVHDRGVDELNEEEKQVLYRLIGKLKDQIWP